MPTHTLTHLTGTNDHRAAMATLISGASAGDTVVIPANATTYKFTTPADPGDGTPYYAIDLKSGTAGNPITYQIDGNIEAATSSFAGVRASLLGCVKKSYITITGSGSIDGTAIPNVGSEQLRHLMEVRGSNNITVNGASGLRFLNAKGGDCIHFGPTEPTIDDSSRTTCSDILVQDAFFSGAKRNNISVVSMVDGTFRRCEFTGAAGTSPQGGLVFEPEDDDHDELTRILVDDCEGYGNASRDFMVATHSMDSGGGHEPIDVTFQNCLSRRGTLTTPRGFEVSNTDATHTGTIKFINCRAENLNSSGFRIIHNIESELLIEVTRCALQRTGLSGSEAPIVLVLTGAADGEGITFTNVHCTDTLNRAIVSATSAGGDATNVTGIVDRMYPAVATSQAVAVLPSLSVNQLRRRKRAFPKTSY